MQIALYGATGQSGSRILTELLARGHEVKAIVRDPAKVKEKKGLTVVEGDVASVEEIAAKIKGVEAVVSAYAPPLDDPDQIITVNERFIEAVKQMAVKRFIYVGGAASLEIAPGLTLLDSGHLPGPWIPIATSHAKALEAIKESGINWTSFSPAAYFGPGERTGKFRLGKDMLIADDKQESKISMEDYAIALVDELEGPKHQRERFTIGY